MMFFFVMPLMMSAFMLNSYVGMPLGLPPGPEDPTLAQAAPDECFFFMTWNQAADLDGAQLASSTERWMAQDEIQEAVAAGGQWLEDMIDQRSVHYRGGVETLQLVDLIMFDLPRRATVVYITDLEPKTHEEFGGFVSGYEISDGAIAIRVEDQGDKYLERLNQFIALVRQRMPVEDESQREIDGGAFQRLDFAHPDPWGFTVSAVEWGLWDQYLVIGLGDRGIDQFIARAQSAAPEWLTDIKRRSRVPRVASIARLDMQRVNRMIEQQLEDAPMMPGSPLDDLGFANFVQLAWISGLDDESFVGHTLLDLDGEPQGMARWIGDRALEQRHLRHIPADATYAVASRLSPNEVLESIVAMARSAGAEDEFQYGLDQLRDWYGVDLRDDILRYLEDYFYVYGHIGTEWEEFTLTLCYGVRDVMNFGHVYQSLMGELETQMPGMILRHEHQAFTIYHLPGMPLGPMMMGPAPSVELAWALTADELVFGTSPDLVAEHLDRVRRPAESLTDAPHYRALWRSDDLGGPLSIIHLNPDRLLAAVYDWMREEIDRDTAADFPRGVIPSLESLLQFSRPMQTAFYRVSSGFESLSRQTWPGSPPPGMLGLVMGWSTAVEVRPPEPWNQSRQLLIAMHNYHDAHGSMPPAYTVDDEGQPLLSWRVHVLPYLDEGELYEQFRLDEPWDSEHNRQLVERMPDVFRSFDLPDEPGKTRYLAATGTHAPLRTPDPDDRRTWNRGHRLEEMPDGTSNIVVVVNVDPDHAVQWTRPEDILVEPETDIRQYFERSLGPISAALADGSVLHMRMDIDNDVWRALMTINSGEVIDFDELRWPFEPADFSMPVEPPPPVIGEDRPDTDGS